MQRTSPLRFVIPFLLGAPASAMAQTVPSASAAPIQQRAPQLPDGSDAASVEQWRNYAPVAINTPKVEESNVVVIRPLNEVPGGVVNIFVDGEYQSSLRPGSYTQATICPGNARLTSAYTDVSTRYLEKQNEGQVVPVAAGKINYFVVAYEQGRLVTRPLTADRADKLLASVTLQQRYTIPRVNKRVCAAR